MPIISFDLSNSLDRKRYTAMRKSGLYRFIKVPETASIYRGFVILPFTN